MPTLRENLITRQNAIGEELAAMSATTAGGKPDASKAGVQHRAYKDGLYAELTQIQEQLDRLDLNATDGNTTVFEILSIGET